MNDELKTPNSTFSVHHSSLHTVRMKFVGANPAPRVVGLDELPGKVNYFIGNDPIKWRTNVSTYAKIKYEDLYPGIDLIYYGDQRQLEYDFVVAPAADPKVISLAFEGLDKLEVDTKGDLALHTAAGQIRQHKPLGYQEVNGIRQVVAGSYTVNSRYQIGFDVAEYDPGKPLIIDPVLIYSTYPRGQGQGHLPGNRGGRFRQRLRLRGHPVKQLPCGPGAPTDFRRQ